MRIPIGTVLLTLGISSSLAIAWFGYKQIPHPQFTLVSFVDDTQFSYCEQIFKAYFPHNASLQSNLTILV